jgi:Uma2 family endonuclease
MAQPLRDTSPEPPRTFESFADFLAWTDEDGGVEWVGGKVVTMSPASTKHQNLMALLLGLLKLHVEAGDLGWVGAAPFLMHLPERSQGREPDLLFVRSEHLDRLGDTYLEGPADLAVEITSPESLSRDRGEKFVEYEAAGVAEYWLIDPLRRQAEVYHLGDDGRYHPVPAEDHSELGWVVVSRAVDGFRLPVDRVFSDPLPKLADTARALGLL